MNPQQTNLYSWVAPEYVRNDRTVDWYWAVAILGAVGVFACVYFGNALFGVIILISTILLISYAARPVPVYDVGIGDSGVAIANTLLQYKNITEFWIENHPHEGYKLLLRPNVGYSSVLVIPIQKEIPVTELRTTLLQYIPEVEMSEPILVRLFEAIF